MSGRKEPSAFDVPDISRRVRKEPAESITFRGLGISIACLNPGKKTIIIVIALLLFIIIMTLLLRSFVIPGPAALRLKSLFGRL